MIETNANGVMYSFKDVYNELKTKSANGLRYNTYFDILLDTLLEMFEYEGLPDTIPTRFLELYLHTYGKVFIAKIKGEIYAAGGTLSGEIDAYSLGTDAIAVCPIGETSGKRDVDIVYGINNKTATPDMLIYWISHLLQENDNSLEHIIKYSRLLPIPKVKDEKDKTALDEIINKLLDGDLKAFLSKNVLSDEFGEGVDVLNLSDVNKVDKLQYLSRFADDILKKFYNFYGQPINSQNKTAQSISDEIHGMDSVSFILPLQMLKCRQKMCDDINRIFGLNVSVHFSETWELEYKALILRDTNNNGTADISEQDGTDPEQGGTETEQGGTDPEQGGTDPEQDGTETEQGGTDPEQGGTDPEQDGTDTVIDLSGLSDSEIDTIKALVVELKEGVEEDVEQG